MSFLDFLLGQRPHPADQGGMDPDGGMIAPQPGQPPGAPPQAAPVGQPQAEPHQGLLGSIGHFLTSPQGMLMAGTALRSLGGEQDAGMDAVRIGAQMRAERMKEEQLARARQLQIKRNAAFKAAYQNGRFDPSIYAAAAGDAFDPRDMAELAKTVAPKVSYQNDHIITENPLTGDTSVGDALPKSFTQLTAEAQAAESARHNKVEEGQGDQRIGIERGQLGVAQANAATSRAQLGVAQGHLGLDQQSAQFERQKLSAQRYPGVPIVTAPGDYARLPSKSQYIAPDGSVRIKP